MRNAMLIVIVILTLCGIFEKMTSFSPILNPDLEQGKLMAAVNSRKERSKKQRVILFVMD